MGLFVSDFYQRARVEVRDIARAHSEPSLCSASQQLRNSRAITVSGSLANFTHNNSTSCAQLSGLVHPSKATSVNYAPVTNRQLFLTHRLLASKPSGDPQSLIITRAGFANRL